MGSSSLAAGLMAATVPGQDTQIPSPLTTLLRLPAVRTPHLLFSRFVQYCLPGYYPESLLFRHLKDVSGTSFTAMEAGILLSDLLPRPHLERSALAQISQVLVQPGA